MKNFFPSYTKRTKIRELFKLLHITNLEFYVKTFLYPLGKREMVFSFHTKKNTRQLIYFFPQDLFLTQRKHIVQNSSTKSFSIYIFPQETKSKLFAIFYLQKRGVILSRLFALPPPHFKSLMFILFSSSLSKSSCQTEA